MIIFNQELNIELIYVIICLFTLFLMCIIIGRLFTKAIREQHKLRGQHKLYELYKKYGEGWYGDFDDFKYDMESGYGSDVNMPFCDICDKEWDDYLRKNKLN